MAKVGREGNGLHIEWGPLSVGAEHKDAGRRERKTKTSCGEKQAFQQKRKQVQH